MLFVRDSRRTTLTPGDRALLSAARRALAADDEGRDAVTGVRGVLHGQLHIGTNQTLGSVGLPSLLTAFHRAHPGVTIRLNQDAGPALARAAADGRLDVTFVDGSTDQSRPTRVDLGHDDLLLAEPRGDPPAKLARIGLDDHALRERRFVDYPGRLGSTRQIDVACAAGLARRTTCERGTCSTSSSSSNTGPVFRLSPCEPSRDYGTGLHHPHHTAAAL